MRLYRLHPCDKNSLAEQLLARRRTARYGSAMAVLCVLLTLVLFPSHLAASAKVTVLASPGISPIKEDRIRAIIREAAAELRVPEEHLQEFVVVLISRKDPIVRHWPGTTRMVVTRAVTNIINYGEDLSTTIPAATMTATLYYLWIIDDSSDATLATAIITAIDQEEGLRLSADDVIAVAKRVCIRVSATVPATSLR